MNNIETDRLNLRRFLLQDAADLYEYLHKPTANCFLSLALKDISSAENEVIQRSESDEYLAVCVKGLDKLIGDLFAIKEGDTFSIGWNFNPRFVGIGFAFEAASALVNHLFTEKQARRLYAYVEDTNLPSQRLCEKLGMRREGIFKEFISFINDSHGLPVYENTMQYALLSKDWSHF